jgi:hypothetical protein
MADAHHHARETFERYKATFKDRYPKAVETIEHRLDMFLHIFYIPGSAL